MLFSEEPSFPSLSAAWSYLQVLLEPELPELKTLQSRRSFRSLGQRLLPYPHLPQKSLTVGSAWPHTQSAGGVIIERLRSLAQPLVWAQETLGFGLLASARNDSRIPIIFWRMADCRSCLVQWSRFRRPTRSESNPGRPSALLSRM